MLLIIQLIELFFAENIAFENVIVRIKYNNIHESFNLIFVNIQKIFIIVINLLNIYINSVQIKIFKCL